MACSLPVKADLASNTAGRRPAHNQPDLAQEGVTGIGIDKRQDLESRQSVSITANTSIESADETCHLERQFPQGTPAAGA
jgi:hypothetical protein